MPFTFWLQHWSTDLRHHSALFFEARMGLPPTVTKTGLVWELGRIRRATQLDFLMGSRKDTFSCFPSALISFLAAGRPLTTASKRTFRESPMRARSMSQYGFSW